MPMATPFPADHPLLQGAFEPIRMECDYADLMIQGELPTDLAGTLYRIGPNPQFAPKAPYNPLQGEGMIHAFQIANGRVAYRNRWVRTRRWALERDAGRALFATANPRDHDPAVVGIDGQGAANTHILAHAGRLLALEEGNAPIEIDSRSLETIGPFDFAGRLPGNMTAHPRIDPETGEMVFFANFPGRAFDGSLALYTANAEGEIVHSIRIRGPYPAFVHDFAITCDHVVFVVCPAALSLERLMAGGPPIAWEPNRGAVVGVLSRRGDGEDVRWLPAPAHMVWHLLNAFDEDGRIQIDLCQQRAAAFPTADGTPPSEPSLQQFLARWTVDLRADGQVSVHQLSDVVCEYPRMDDRHAGQPYRYGFVAACGGPGTGDPLHRAIGRFDFQAGEMQLWRAPDGQAVSEPVFVARSGATEEGDGYLLATVFDERRNASHLAILEAQHVEQGPVARAYLDHRLPAGFHGSFVVANA